MLSDGIANNYPIYESLLSAIHNSICISISTSNRNTND